MGSLTPAEGQRRPHAVCVPFPTQGHITPMLKLAKLLHARGFHVTFVNTEFNHRRLLHTRGPNALDGVPGFRFDAIPDGLPPSDADATQDIPALCNATMTKCLPHLLSLLARINGDADESPPVTCLVVDAIMSFGFDAGREIGVPVVAFLTVGACGCGYMGIRNFSNLIELGLVPFKHEADLADVRGGHLATVVTGAYGMCDGVQLRDFPSFVRTTDRGDVMLNFLLHESERISLVPDAVIINTFEDLEGTTLDAMRGVLPTVYPVGPLLLRERHEIPAGSPLAGLGCNLWKEQEGVLEWLASRAPRSMVYVNYGSITVMTNSQLLEFAWGLADSGYPFVWNVRPDLVKGDSAVLPPEFASAVESRALLTMWCAQEAVLQHKAVGVFLTHSGWNSTLESLCAGVPMLSWPFFAEQQTNCRYKRTEWGIGMEIGGEVQRDEVAAILKEAMHGEKGWEMRQRAEEWKEKAAKVALPGGPAETNLDRIIHTVLLQWRSQDSKLGYSYFHINKKKSTVFRLQ